MEAVAAGWRGFSVDGKVHKFKKILTTPLASNDRRLVMFRSFISVLLLIFIIPWLAAGLQHITITFKYADNDQGPAPLCSNCTHNRLYMDTYACSEGDDSFSATTMQKFQDPVGPNHIIVAYGVEIHGRFICAGNASRLLLMLQTDKLIDRIFDSSEYEIGCNCPNCVDVYGYNTFNYTSPRNYSGIFQTYVYSMYNYVIPYIPRLGPPPTPAGAICLSQIRLTLYYIRKPPDINYITPQGGPIEGGTTVTVNGNNFIANDSTLSCVFGDRIVPATYLSPQYIECVTPNVAGMYENTMVMVGIQSHGDRDSPTTVPFFFYKQPQIYSISPTQASLGASVNTVVTIVGSDFVEHPEYNLRVRCRFGSQLSETVTIINSSVILCTAPQFHRTASVPIAISLNGIQWYTSSNWTFYYSDSQTSLPIYLWIGIATAIFLIVLVLFIATVVRRTRKKREIAGERKALLGSGALLEYEDFGESQLDMKEVKIGRRIGKGSFGEVYLGTWSGTTVAIKKLPAHKLTEEFLREFAREARLMRSLRHPNVLQFLGACLDPPDICIVTEYMPRGSLYQLIHDKTVTLTWERIRLIALDAAKGMAYLHYRTPAIIHRDLKSHNLLVDENWKVKVSDFGLSRIYGEAQANAMTACGTPCWTAPEILRNSPYSTKADVYSFGVVLWELAAREEPFLGLPAFQVIFAVGTKGARPEIPSYTPSNLAKLIQQCWHEDPSCRPNFQEIIDYLENCRFDDELNESVNR